MIDFRDRGALTLIEAALYLGVGVEDIAAGITEGHIPTVRIGDAWVIPKVRLDEALSCSRPDVNAAMALADAHIASGREAAQ